MNLMVPAIRTIAVVALTTTLVSCGSRAVPASTPTIPVETLRIYTTTATFPLTTDFIIAYPESHPQQALETHVGNFRVMLEALNSGEAPYFISNHLPSESLLWAAPIGQDGIAIITHVDVNLDGISIEQLRDIYQGRVARWSELGGESIEIVVLSREDGSGTRGEFEDMVMGWRQTTLNARIISSSAYMMESVAKLPGSIGYVSISYLNNSVRALAIDGIEPTQRNVFDNRYPLRSTIFVAGLEEPEGSYRTLIGWMQSPPGQAVVAQQYAPLFPINP